MLTPRDIEQYGDAGYCIARGLFAEAAVSACLARLDAYEGAHAPAERPRLNTEILRYKPHLLFTWLDALVHDTRLLDVVAALIGPDILVWASAIFSKDPHSASYIAWHQDSVTYGLDGGALVSAWIALTDSGPDNAAMQFIPGTHRLGPVSHSDTWAKDNALSRGEVIGLAIDAHQAVDVTLGPGDVSLHHIDLVHGSPPNRSARRRIGYAVRYMTPDMRPRVRPASAMLARGVDTHGHFELEPRPAADRDAAAVAAHREALALRQRAVLGQAGSAAPDQASGSDR